MIGGRGGDVVDHPRPRFECVAEAFTRRGRPVDHTRTAEVRRDRIVKTKQLKNGWDNRMSTRGLTQAVREILSEPVKEFNWC